MKSLKIELLISMFYCTSSSISNMGFLIKCMSWSSRADSAGHFTLHIHIHTHTHTVQCVCWQCVSLIIRRVDSVVVFEWNRIEYVSTEYV